MFNYIFAWCLVCVLSIAALLYKFPSGNQVDGLPLVLHNETLLSMSSRWLDNESFYTFRVGHFVYCFSQFMQFSSQTYIRARDIFSDVFWIILHYRMHFNQSGQLENPIELSRSISSTYKKTSVYNLWVWCNVISFSSFMMLFHDVWYYFHSDLIVVIVSYTVWCIR